jgi:recombination protein RecR
MYYAKPLARLVAELEKLPGIGPKSAQRLAFYLLQVPAEEAQQLAAAIMQVKEQVRSCSVCFNYTDQEVCEICSNARRDRTLLCVVADPRDLLAIERTNEFRGLYHVLGGVISPMEGIGPDQLRLRELLERVHRDQVKEVILATNPQVEGEATAMYVHRLLKPLGINVSKIAFGLPMGGDLDYADPATLIQALGGRRPMDDGRAETDRERASRPPDDARR